ncbi:hypothetical protein [Alsobacter sp. R-9]
MRIFLLACVAVIAIAAGAYAVLEEGLRRNAGDAFAVKGSTRVGDAAKPDPRGFLASQHQPAGGVTSGRSPAGGTTAGVQSPP